MVGEALNGKAVVNAETEVRGCERSRRHAPWKSWVSEKAL